MKNSQPVAPLKERRLVTILFADISGFTALSENLDPEELSESISICFEILNRIITNHGGIIHKYEGDSVLAIFGLPQAHEDDPERGVKAALEMMERIPEINSALNTKLKTECSIGLHVGVNLGTVFAGTIGSIEKKEYTIIGEAVNMASRLMDAAEDGVILVSGRIFRQTRYLIDYEPLKPIKVKGISKPVQIFKPLNIKEKPGPKRGIEGFRSAMVERDKEFALLCSKIDLLMNQKKGGIIFVLGEAGIGKTRILEELKEYIKTQTAPLLMLESRCLSYGEAITNFPILEILKQLFLITDQDTVNTISEKIHESANQLMPETCDDVIPYLFYLFSVPLPVQYKDKVKHLDADGLKIQISVALKDLLCAAAKQNPILLVVEDYHWIDSASLDLLKFIFDTSETMPLLLMCLSRIEKESEGEKVKKYLKQRYGDEFTEIELSVLSREASQKLTENLLKVSGITTEAQREILNKAEGNPLYLEEILRSLIDAGFLIHDSGTWKSSEELTISGIPDSIQEIIATRLDFLEPDLKKLVQRAAVIGRSFIVSLLERITMIDSLMMSVHLATLEEMEYVRLHIKEPELEYIFKHPMVQEVVYNSLPIKDRRQLHGQIAEIIEQVFSNRIHEFTELLAYHYSNSNYTEKAIEWLEKAGLHAKERYANDQAILYFGKLISVIDQLTDVSDQHRYMILKAWEMVGDTYVIRGAYDDALKAYAIIKSKSNDPVMRARAQRKSARVYWHQSNFNQSLDIINQALELLIGDSAEVLTEQAELYMLQSANHEIQGSISEAESAIERALSIVEDMRDSTSTKKIRATGLMSLGGIHRNHGEYQKAVDLYEQSRVLFEELNDKQSIGNVIFLIGIIYHMMGDPKRSIELNEQSLVIFEQIGDKKNIGRICTNLGIMYSYLNEGDKTLKFHKKALAISMEIGDKRGQGMAYSNLAIFYLSNDNYEKAHEYFQKYLDIAEKISDKTGISAALGNLAILFIRTKEYDKAEEYLVRAVKIIKELGNKQLLSTAYIYIAEIKRLKQASLDEALEYLNQAWALAVEIGHKANQADCANNYAKVYATIKNFKKSEEYMGIASNLFAELGRVKVMEDAFQQYASILNAAGEIKLAEQYYRKIEELADKT